MHTFRLLACDGANSKSPYSPETSTADRPDHIHWGRTRPRRVLHPTRQSTNRLTTPQRKQGQRLAGALKKIRLRWKSAIALGIARFFERSEREKMGQG